MEDYKETRILTEVTENEDNFTISFSGMGTILKKKYGAIPKKGDSMTVYTKGGSFGTIRGMDLNGEKVFYKTDEELEAYRLKWKAYYEAEKLKAFTENEEEMNAQYEALPKVFKERINRFRENNSAFRVDYESYELFCCEQAILIASNCKTPIEIQKFSKKGWDDQFKQVPTLSKDHSGNTFGVACNLAYWYLENSENVKKIHGSLSTLVGSDEYGDTKKEDDEKV